MLWLDLFTAGGTCVWYFLERFCDFLWGHVFNLEFIANLSLSLKPAVGKIAVWVRDMPNCSARMAHWLISKTNQLIYDIFGNGPWVFFCRTADWSTQHVAKGHSLSSCLQTLLFFSSPVQSGSCACYPVCSNCCFFVPVIVVLENVDSIVCMYFSFVMPLLLNAEYIWRI